ncbi:hypothetical protein MTR67_035411 [Solanum verrucosum]|uniref:Uncharacterized protein n=1 Tax=Solanum verrucosum TaxID=315347 RepID=A0AAF0UAI1_SOLVR|nr:hypothetical protein MTR67_035411 [Solanum verrucosum]
MTFHPQMDGYHFSIGMVPFKSVYGRRCRDPTGWFEVGEVSFTGPNLVCEAMKKV